MYVVCTCNRRIRFFLLHFFIWGKSEERARFESLNHVKRSHFKRIRKLKPNPKPGKANVKNWSIISKQLPFNRNHLYDDARSTAHTHTHQPTNKNITSSERVKNRREKKCPGILIVCARANTHTHKHSHILSDIVRLLTVWQCHQNRLNE